MTTKQRKRRHAANLKRKAQLLRREQEALNSVVQTPDRIAEIANEDAEWKREKQTRKHESKLGLWEWLCIALGVFLVVVVVYLLVHGPIDWNKNKPTPNTVTIPAQETSEPAAAPLTKSDGLKMIKKFGKRAPTAKEIEDAKQFDKMMEDLEKEDSNKKVETEE